VKTLLDRKKKYSSSFSIWPTSPLPLLGSVLMVRRFSFLSNKFETEVTFNNNNLLYVYVVSRILFRGGLAPQILVGFFFKGPQKKKSGRSLNMNYKGQLPLPKAPIHLAV
jgi:hypothetical protein